jgi:hypothetical protein
MHVHIPPPVIRASGKASKAPSPQIYKSGPLLFMTKMEKKEFMSQLAENVPCRLAALPESKLQWRFEKPAKDMEKPLTNDAGTMQCSLHSRNKRRIMS